jgi:hypothetical protein
LTNLAQIRYGPGFNYSVHTTLSVGCWTVYVTEVRSDGWINIDRKRAGDPSGGTGWTRVEQIDGCMGM